MGRKCGIEHRRLDAGSSGHLADDFSYFFPYPHHHITMVQSAGSFPMVLLALPAGALADIADRRHILLVSQFWMMTMAVLLTCLTFSGTISPSLLLTFTGALALGTALMGPAFQSVITELVPSSQMGSAVALNRAGYNLVRAVGPAIAGLILALARSGASIAFAVNALSFLGVIIVLFRWRSKTRKSVLPAERFVSAMRVGVRYVRYAPALQTVLLRTGAFVLFGSAIWALLPLVVIKQLAGGPSAYGIMLGALGAGALFGTMILPTLKEAGSFGTSGRRQYRRLRGCHDSHLADAHSRTYVRPTLRWRNSLDHIALAVQCVRPQCRAWLDRSTDAGRISISLSRGNGSGKSIVGRGGGADWSATGAVMCRHRTVHELVAGISIFVNARRSRRRH